MRAPKNFYRRIRCFCDLTVQDVSAATGVSQSRVAAIENLKTEPNAVERLRIETYLRARVAIVFQMDGPMPAWVGGETVAPAPGHSSDLMVREA